MKPILTVILKFSSILLLLLILNWWVLILSPFNIPQFIPFTPININGLSLFIIVITILILAQKSILKLIPTLSVIKLTGFGVIIGLTSEIIFQIIRSFTLTEDKLYYFLQALFTMSISYIILSFFIAFQLKTRRTRYLMLFIAAFYMIFYLILYLFPSIPR